MAHAGATGRLSSWEAALTRQLATSKSKRADAEQAQSDSKAARSAKRSGKGGND